MYGSKLPSKGYKPAARGHVGQKAGGAGTYGKIGASSGASHKPTDPSGRYGKTTSGGKTSATAKAMIGKSTGLTPKC